MGWRVGKGVGIVDEAPSIGKWGRVANLGPENTPLHLVTPKVGQTICFSIVEIVSISISICNSCTSASCSVVGETIWQPVFM